MKSVILNCVSVLCFFFFVPQLAFTCEYCGDCWSAPEFWCQKTIHDGHQAEGVARMIALSARGGNFMTYSEVYYLDTPDNKYDQQYVRYYTGTGRFSDIQVDTLIEQHIANACLDLEYATGFYNSIEDAIGNGEYYGGLADDAWGGTPANRWCELHECYEAQGWWVNHILRDCQADYAETDLDEAEPPLEDGMEEVDGAEQRMDHGFDADTWMQELLDTLSDCETHYNSTSQDLVDYDNDYDTALARYNTLVASIGSDTTCSNALSDISDALDDMNDLLTSAFTYGNYAYTHSDDADDEFQNLHTPTGTPPTDNYQDAKAMALDGINDVDAAEGYLDWADGGPPYMDSKFTTLDDRCDYAEANSEWPD